MSFVVCMHVCVFVRSFVFVFFSMCDKVCVRMLVCSVYLFLCACVHIYAGGCICVCGHVWGVVCMFLLLLACVCICMLMSACAFLKINCNAVAAGD
jgi:hypothetical protein